MKIAVSINEVLRDFLSQFIYTYNKYIDEKNISVEDIDNFDLINFFPFEDVDKLNHFLYLEAPLEIFGHADQITDGLINKFNDLCMLLEDEEEHTIELVSREVNKAIPATLFFLSKTSCRCPNIRFVKNYSDKWNNVDVLITANPKALEAKPNGKISVKIKTPYNKNIKADYELESILDFIKDENLRNEILKLTITTTFEEIK